MVVLVVWWCGGVGSGGSVVVLAVVVVLVVCTSAPATASPRAFIFSVENAVFHRPFVRILTDVNVGSDRRQCGE